MSTDDLLEKQYRPLQKQIAHLFTKYPVNLSRRINFEQQISKLFSTSFGQKLPIEIKQRAIMERQVIHSIKFELKKQNLILRRTADDQNIYYLGKYDEFQNKAREYLDQSSAHLYSTVITQRYPEQNETQDLLKSIDFRLTQLHERKIIKKEQLNTFLTEDKKSKLKLPRLYFLPNVDSNGKMSVEPRFSSYKNSPIQYLAQYLEQIIRPLFHSSDGSTIVYNSHDFITKFRQYRCQKDNQRYQMHFGTFKITNLHIYLSHQHILEALIGFLACPLFRGRHPQLSTDAIVHLTALVLRNNSFIYENGIYRFAQGYPLNLPFFELLGDIYLHQWQASILRQIRAKDQFYVRFHNQAFMTWDATTYELERVLNQAQQNLPSGLEFISCVQKYARFLNCYMENKNGQFYSTIDHSTIKQPFALPFVTGHPRILHRQWYRFMLMRASQCCSDFEDFDDERRYIELTFLANGYSVDFVDCLWTKFRTRFRFSPLDSRSVDKSSFYRFREEIYSSLRYPHESYQQQLQQDYDLLKNKKLIELNYLYDWGSRCEFNRKFNQLWASLINQDPIFKKHGLKVILNSNHCYLSNRLLACIKI